MDQTLAVYSFSMKQHQEARYLKNKPLKSQKN
jgi:hypothetical protein